MSKPWPWMPIHVGDTLREAASLSPSEIGSYLLLLIHYWDTGVLPTDSIRLQRIARASNANWPSVKQALTPLFGAPADGSEWIPERLRQSRLLVEEKRNKNKENVLRRYNHGTTAVVQSLILNKKEKKEEEYIPAFPPSGGMPKKNGYSPEFEEFWRVYPRGEAKKAAYEAYQKAVKQGATSETILQAIFRQAPKMKLRPEYIPYAQKWLNQGRYEDRDVPEPVWRPM